MTNITELAQSLKAAAEKATPGEWVYFPKNTSIEYDVGSDESQGSILYVDSGDFTQAQTDRNGEFIALANPANILALVEALEKAQTINAAAEKLVRCKGRYHSEQNYRALAALFGVTGVWFAAPIAEGLALCVSIFCVWRYRRIYPYGG